MCHLPLMESLFHFKRFTTLTLKIQISNFVLNMAYDYAHCFRQDLKKLLQIRSDTIWNGTPCLRNYCFLLSNDFLTAWRVLVAGRKFFSRVAGCSCRLYLLMSKTKRTDFCMKRRMHVLFKKAHTKFMSRNKRTMKIFPWILWCLLIRLILSCEPELLIYW